MPLDLTTDCTFAGPALPEPFVKFNLEAELNRLSLLPKTTGADARPLDEQWQFIRRKLRNLASRLSSARAKGPKLVSPGQSESASAALGNPPP